MKTTERSRCARARRRRRAAALLALALGGCALPRPGGDEASAEYLSPAGWDDPSSVFDGGTFERYAEAVRARLVEHRIAFSEATTALELDVASPAEYAPGPDCAPDGERGIAILVHGLSDTAFALSDVARALAARCWRARTILLPGHGTRAGDLLDVDHRDWLYAVRESVAQAAGESARVAVVGYSLGAVLAGSVALEPGADVDAIVAISPAYHLSGWRLARWAPWLGWARPWIDRGPPDDYARYEAMPTRGVAETVRAIRRLRGQLDEAGEVVVPWLLVQSLDDAVTDPEGNIALHREFASAPASRVVAFRTDGETGFEDEAPDPGITWLRGDDADRRVRVLSHLAVHVSPDNPHYGPGGDYRGCGAGTPRPVAAIERCLSASAQALHHGAWDMASAEDVPLARAAFNPRFDALIDEIDAFLEDGRRARSGRLAGHLSRDRDTVETDPATSPRTGRR